MNKLILGDCLEVLRKIELNSIDSLITDPPAGISFMGKAWDSDKGGRDVWIDWMTQIMSICLDVLKPGAHGLVWALPRTSHWTVTALENAGFEVRDIITHLFGSGFPKNLDISKAIDKAAGVEREILGVDPNQAGRKKNTGIIAGQSQYDNEASPRIAYITTPATNEAKQWHGWGTGLKPAAEYWVLVRKPLAEKTTAANVLRHGTGGINIRACKIGSRFPANIILDESTAQILGSPACFFYISKVSKKDRGLNNTHPTVKSTKLMEYLITLITPSAGTVLDPFMGSGSTGVAAKRLNFSFIGIEKESNYFEIAKKRHNE